MTFKEKYDKFVKDRGTYEEYCAATWRSYLRGVINIEEARDAISDHGTELSLLILGIKQDEQPNKP